MFKTRLLGTALLLGSVLIAGCTSNTVQPSAYSGFLGDYSGLTEDTTSTGQKVMRWQNPDFKMSNYGNAVFQPAAYYPAPLPTERVSSDTLQKVLDYINKQVGGALRYRMTEAQKPGPGKLNLRAAITGVSATDQGLKPYEFIPVAMLVAGAETASGHRTQYAELNIEAEMVDAETGKPQVKVVRKILGKTVNNNKQPITFDDLKEAIDNLAKDIRAYK